MRLPLLTAMTVALASIHSKLGQVRISGRTGMVGSENNHDLIRDHVMDTFASKPFSQDDVMTRT